MSGDDGGGARRRSEGAGQDPASVSGQICPADGRRHHDGKGIWRKTSGLSGTRSEKISPMSGGPSPGLQSPARL